MSRSSGCKMRSRGSSRVRENRSLSRSRVSWARPFQPGVCRPEGPRSSHGTTTLQAGLARDDARREVATQLSPLGVRPERG